MPRKRSDENLTKVISSIISIEDFEILVKYARVYYTKNLLKLPTTSHMVRYILNNWADQRRKNEQLAHNSDLNKLALNKLSKRTVKRDQTTWLEFSKDGY